jgi:hypothetical protein
LGVFLPWLPPRDDLREEIDVEVEVEVEFNDWAWVEVFFSFTFLMSAIEKPRADDICWVTLVESAVGCCCLEVNGPALLLGFLGAEEEVSTVSVSASQSASFEAFFFRRTAYSMRCIEHH